MNTYVMSDIHGRDTAYFEMLKKIGFDDFAEGDHLYILGDCIDRGAGSAKVLKHIYENQHKITLLMGNHEKMMLDSFKYTFSSKELNEEQIAEINESFSLWLYNGGEATYNGFCEFDEDTQKGIIEFIANLPYHKEITFSGVDYYLVHGSPAQDNTTNLSTPRYEEMLWREMKPNLKIEGKTVIFGHKFTVFYHEEFEFDFRRYTKAYPIYKTDGMIGIDCGCALPVGYGQLGCLRLEDMWEVYCSV